MKKQSNLLNIAIDLIMFLIYMALCHIAFGCARPPANVAQLEPITAQVDPADPTPTEPVNGYWPVRTAPNQVTYIPPVIQPAPGKTKNKNVGNTSTTDKSKDKSKTKTDGNLIDGEGNTLDTSLTKDKSKSKPKVKSEIDNSVGSNKGSVAVLILLLILGLLFLVGIFLLLRKAFR